MMFGCWMTLLVRRVQGCNDGKGESRTEPPHVSRLVGSLGNRKHLGTILSKGLSEGEQSWPKRKNSGGKHGPCAKMAHGCSAKPLLTRFRGSDHVRVWFLHRQPG